MYEYRDSGVVEICTVLGWLSMRGLGLGELTNHDDVPDRDPSSYPGLELVYDNDMSHNIQRSESCPA
jgi:hypothetical protein